MKKRLDEGVGIEALIRLNKFSATYRIEIVSEGGRREMNLQISEKKFSHYLVKYLQIGVGILRLSADECLILCRPIH